MATKRTVLSQSDRSFWRDIYRVAAQELIGRYDGRRNRVRLIAEDAGEHADAALDQLRERAHHWSRS
jgi:hypothetical protein